jgi:iron(III) transport system permease protein
VSAEVGVRPAVAPWRLELQTILCTVVLLLVGFLVLYPLGVLVVGSFEVSQPGAPAVYSLEGWRTAFTQPGIQSAIVNTVTLAVTYTALSMAVATFVAWALARTDVPGKELLELGFWVAFFLPTLPVILAWVLLLDPQFGLINVGLAQGLGLPPGLFNIYSWWGIVFGHLITHAIAIKVMLLVPAFRNMDSALEEASLVAGASGLGTTLRIMLPIMTPAVLLVSLLGVIRGLEAFEIELVLGLPERINVYSTMIYRLVHQSPTQYGPATALGVMILGIMAPVVVLQQWFVARRRYTTVTSHFRIGTVELGPFKWPVFFAILLLVCLLTIVPAIFLAVSTLMRVFGFFTIAEPWTTMHWAAVFADPIFLSSVRNTLLIAGGCAIAAALVYSVIAYIVVRTQFWGRRVLDFLCWAPVALPGLLLSLGYLWMFLDVPLFRPLYGSHWVLILALVLGGMTLGTQLVKAALLQLGNELEEASWVAGGAWWYTYWRVILPLLKPCLLTVAIIAFVNTARNIGTIVLLSTSATRPLSLLQLDFLVDGRYESAAVVGMLIVVLTLGVTLVARALGLSLGIGAGRT